MKKFLLNGICCALLVAGCLVGIVAVRLCLWQKDVNAVFVVRPSTRVLCIGNSHTGCTWDDSDELGIQVSWSSATSLPFYWIRLSELERCGGFGDIKTVVMDCCGPSRGVSEDSVARAAIATFPISWRYLTGLPVGMFALVRKLFMPLNSDWSVIDDQPNDDRKWTNLTRKQRDEEIADVYKSGKEIRSDGDAIILDYLARIRDICNRYGIRLVLFFAPLPSDNPQRNDARLGVWKATLEKYGYKVLDFRTVCQDDDFRDCHHLSRDGRKKFTSQYLQQIAQ